MITTAAHVPVSSLKGLWEAAFGDGREYIDFFFSHRFSPGETLVDVRDGTAAAMLFLLDVSLCLEGETENGYYLYAACTLPQMQKQGIMGALLKAARQFALQRGRAFIALKPATPTLFGYYEKQGYATCFTRRTARVSATGSCEVHRVTVQELHKIQFDYALGGTSVWPQSGLAYALEENSTDGCALLCSRGGQRLALLAHEGGDGLYITDAWGDGTLFGAAVAALGAPQAQVSAPPWMAFPQGVKSRLVPHGMLLPVDKAFSLQDKNMYLSLTLG